ncbi:hypothetical protein M758_2G057700 [Ceratodon purpureus]|nr:hypothetical protein M758_2G057700 [Ceratodon purpureus]
MRHNSDDASPRGMSTNTKRGAWGSVQSTRVPEKKGGSAHDKGDKWRKDFMEKQAKQQKKFDNVKAPPSIKDEDWWTPDPMTGVYVPEYYHGYVTTAPRETRKKGSAGGASYLRIDTDQDQGQAPWFDNMEELPDMDRHKKK